MTRRLALALAVALAAAAPASSATVRERLDGARSFAFSAGRIDTSRLAAYDIAVVDGDEVTPAQVRAIRRRGAIVLGYVSVGTIERNRPWTAAARRFRLELWDDWDEWFADTSKPGFRRLVTRRIVPPMLRKGLDGLFLDNVAMIEDHSRQRAGMYRMVRDLSRMLHARGKVIFTQNGASVMGPLRTRLDGWNREDVTGTYDFDRKRYVRTSTADRRERVAQMRRMRRAGIVVTSTDYVRSADRATRALAVRTACAAGALPFVSDIELTRVPAPVRCRR